MAYEDYLPPASADLITEGEDTDAYVQDLFKSVGAQKVGKEFKPTGITGLDVGRALGKLREEGVSWGDIWGGVKKDWKEGVKARVRGYTGFLWALQEAAAKPMDDSTVEVMAYDPLSPDVGTREEAVAMIKKQDAVRVRKRKETVARIFNYIDRHLKPEEIKPGDESAFRRYASGMVQTASQLLIQGAAHIFGGRFAGALMMGAEIQGHSYIRMRQAGVDHDNALIPSFLNAGAQGALEMVGMHRAIKNWKIAGGRGFTKASQRFENATGAGVVEGLTEWAQNFPEQASYLWAVGKQKGLSNSQILNGIANSIVDTAKDGLLDATIGGSWGFIFGFGGAQVSTKPPKTPWDNVVMSKPMEEGIPGDKLAKKIVKKAAFDQPWGKPIIIPQDIVPEEVAVDEAEQAEPEFIAGEEVIPEDAEQTEASDVIDEAVETEEKPPEKPSDKLKGLTDKDIADTKKQIDNQPSFEDLEGENRELTPEELAEEQAALAELGLSEDPSEEEVASFEDINEAALAEIKELEEVPTTDEEAVQDVLLPDFTEEETPITLADIEAKARELGLPETKKPVEYKDADLTIPAVRNAETGEIFEGTEIPKWTVTEFEKVEEAMRKSYQKATIDSGVKDATILERGFKHPETGEWISALDFAEKKKLYDIGKVKEGKKTGKGLKKRKTLAQQRQEDALKRKDEEFEGYQVGMTPAQKARLAKMDTRIKKTAKKIAGAGIDWQDLYQEGRLAALKWVRAGKTGPFGAKNYMLKWMNEQLTKGTAPRSAQERGIAPKFAALKETAELTEKGEVPTIKLVSMAEGKLPPKLEELTESERKQLSVVKLKGTLRPALLKPDGSIADGKASVTKAKQAAEEAGEPAGEDGFLSPGGEFYPATATRAINKFKREFLEIKKKLLAHQKAAEAQAAQVEKAELKKAEKKIKAHKPTVSKRKTKIGMPIVVGGKTFEQSMFEDKTSLESSAQLSDKEAREGHAERWFRREEDNLLQKAKWLDNFMASKGMGKWWKSPELRQGPPQPQVTTTNLGGPDVWRRASREIVEASKIKENIKLAETRAERAMKEFLDADANFPAGSKHYIKARTDLTNAQRNLDQWQKAREVQVDKGLSVLNNERGTINVTIKGKRDVILKTLGKIARAGLGIEHMAMDLIDVEAMWKRVNAPATGLAFKNFYGVRARHQIQSMQDSRGFIKEEKQDFDRELTSKEWLDTVFSAEDPEYFDSLDEKFRSKAASSVNKLNRYFAAKEAIYKLRGIEFDFKARKRRELNDKLSMAEVGSEQEAKILYKLDKLERINYVHIPTQVLYTQTIEQLASKKISPKKRKTLSGLLNLFVEKARTRLTIKEVYDSANEEQQAFIREAINPASIMMNYGMRFSKDMAILDLRDSLEADGLLQKPGTKKKAGFMTLTNRKINGVLTGCHIDPKAYKMIEDLMAVDMAQSRWMRFASLTKMLQFFNPIFLPAYDVYQSLFLSGAHMGAKQLVTMAPNLFRAARSVWNQDENYKEAMSLGLFSKPFDFPWNDYVGYMKDVMKTGKGNSPFMDSIKTIAVRTLRESKDFRRGSVIGAAYHASWNTAWTMDEMIRMWTYMQFQGKGMSKAESAQLAAKAHGDYASVPPKTRRFLNKFLFTPTFKIVMAKYYGSLMKGVLQTMINLPRGKATRMQKQLALGALTMIGAQAAFDAIMKSKGWEPEDEKWWIGDAGRKYVRKVQTRWGVREFVFTWSNPGNLIQRYLDRATRAWDIAEEEGWGKGVFEFAKYDLHPVFRTMLSVWENRRFGGGEIYSRFDDTGDKLLKSVSYIATDLVRMGETVDRQIFGEEGRGKAEARKYAQRKFPWLVEQLMFNPVISIFSGHTRSPEDQRWAFKVRGMKKDFRSTQRRYYMRHGKLNEEWMKNYRKMIRQKIQERQRRK
jgi:hypothetical protein